MLDTIRAVFDCPVLLPLRSFRRAAMAASMPDDPRYFVWPLYGKVDLSTARAGRSTSQGRPAKSSSPASTTG